MYLIFLISAGGVWVGSLIFSHFVPELIAKLLGIPLGILGIWCHQYNIRHTMEELRNELLKIYRR
jgi:fumarate reductase subunit D